MLGIKVTVDSKAAIRSLGDIAQKQMPFATRLAINDIAFQVQRAERANMKQVFRNPRPFTINSTLVKQAPKTTTMAALKAWVYVRRDADKYLEPYEFGGVHVLPGTALLNPKSIRLDQYGQLTKGTPARLKGRPGVFVATIKGITGFWQRYTVRASGITTGFTITTTGVVKRVRQKGRLIRKVRLLIRLGDALPVTEHIDFRGVGVKVVKANWANAIRAAWATAVKNRKP